MNKLDLIARGLWKGEVEKVKIHDLDCVMELNHKFCGQMTHIIRYVQDGIYVQLRISADLKKNIDEKIYNDFIKSELLRMLERFKKENKIS